MMFLKKEIRMEVKMKMKRINEAINMKRLRVLEFLYFSNFFLLLFFLVPPCVDTALSSLTLIDVKSIVQGNQQENL